MYPAGGDADWLLVVAEAGGAQGILTRTIFSSWNRTLSNTTVNRHLSGAIRKHGPEQFRRTILSHASCQQELDLLERFWIAFYRSNQRQYGYNLLSGGLIGVEHHSKETIKRISRASQRIWDSRSSKDRWEFSLASRLRWLNRTEHERDQISRQITKALTGRPRTSPVWNLGTHVGRGQPSKRKGRTFGPQKNPCLCCPPKTSLHRKHISEGMRMHFANLKKPVVGTTTRTPQQH